MAGRQGGEDAADAMGATALPSLVRGYAKRALATESPPAGTVDVEQVGEMVLKPGAAPRRFTAVEVFAVDRVAFAWRARFPIAGPLGLRVTDGYDGRDGLLEVRLLGLPLQRSRGPTVAQGEAFRYLAEIAWVPPAILANRHLRWREIDARTVEVATNAGGAQIAVRLIFNGHGDIEQTVAERPRLESGGALTPWIGVYSDYEKLGGVRIPTRGEVRWELPDGPFTYWRGRITSLELHSAPVPAPSSKEA